MTSINKELENLPYTSEDSAHWSKRSFDDVDRVLRLPVIDADDVMESVYLDQIAFKRFHVGAGNEVTSFVFFMDNMINSSSDVSMQRRCGIIQNASSSYKAVVKLFNSLSKDITLDPDSSLDEVHEQVSAYCNKPCSQWRADTVHTYFIDPWAITAAS